jgi:hypothetical protein
MSANGALKKAKSHRGVSVSSPLCHKYGITSTSGVEGRKPNRGEFSTTMQAVDIRGITLVQVWLRPTGEAGGRNVRSSAGVAAANELPA